MIRQPLINTLEKRIKTARATIYEVIQSILKEDDPTTDHFGMLKHAINTLDGKNKMIEESQTKEATNA